MEKKQYHELLENLFMGGTSDVESMVADEKVNVVIDLRAEATACSIDDPDIECIPIPLTDAKKGQKLQIQKAVNEIVKAMKSGKRVAFH